MARRWRAASQRIIIRQPHQSEPLRTFRTQVNLNSHAVIIDSHAVLLYDDLRVSNYFQIVIHTPGWSKGHAPDLTISSTQALISEAYLAALNKMLVATGQYVQQPEMAAVLN